MVLYVLNICCLLGGPVGDVIEIIFILQLPVSLSLSEIKIY